jgi:hypothetical protein
MSIDPVQVAALGLTSSPAEPIFVRPVAAGTSPTSEAPPSLPQARQLQVNASFGQANLIIYRILDKETGDLIQQIPPEQLLQIARSIQELFQADQTRQKLDVRS